MLTFKGVQISRLIVCLRYGLSQDGSFPCCILLAQNTAAYTSVYYTGDMAPLNFKTLHRNLILAIENHT